MTLMKMVFSPTLFLQVPAPVVCPPAEAPIHFSRSRAHCPASYIAQFVRNLGACFVAVMHFKCFRFTTPGAVNILVAD